MSIAVSILNIPVIDSLEHKFSVGFKLSLSWYDYRLTFVDLNEATSKNVVSVDTVKDHIWLPKVSYLQYLQCVLYKWA